MKRTDTQDGMADVQRVAIVDDHTFMREGMKQFIDSLEGFECAWTAPNATDALTQLDTDMPDVLVVDITLPGRSGLELIKDVHALHPNLPLLVLSMHEETLYAHRAIKAGAKGYLMKSADYEVFERALRKVAAGKLWLSEDIADNILEAFTSGTSPKGTDGLDALTDREFEVFQLLGEGRSTPQIAEAMRISPKTVDVHRANIRAKLKLEDGAAVTRHAIRWGESNRLSASSARQP
ncbi:response regulator transcription factor [Roseimicrobium sp. ORNL1]|uniref:response regulator transcription factor n=1 Tax=Roseimicrobium sp. ORNL1 TaxID=2711231 RepID=UPI0013E20015|nr:response regulator transcription factor [Roseimicrobium sp. ORNL1]QIF04539.1 response regulator transcription factor [Roseimicrobium sp. ORNL1]